MEIQLKSMAMEHIEQISLIEEQCFFTPWSKQALMDELDNPLSYYLVALDGEKVIAYGGFWAVPPEGNINNIAVDPSYRGKGISRILMNSLVAMARERNVKALFLEVRTSNHVAQSLYRSLGFKMINIRKGYYADTDEDAIVMALEIK